MISGEQTFLPSPSWKSAGLMNPALNQGDGGLAWIIELYVCRPVRLGAGFFERF
jgi:hypothetical protein